MTLGIEYAQLNNQAMTPWRVDLKQTLPTEIAIFPPMQEYAAPKQVVYTNPIADYFTAQMKAFQDFMANMTPKVITFANATPMAPIELQPGNDYKLPADAEASFNNFMEYVLKDEGGYVNNPKDPGGATNMGIRKDLFEKIMGPISLADFKNLTKEQAKEYYYKYYWVPSGAKEIAESGNEKLAYTLLDTAIHHGTGKAKKLLAKADGDAEKLLDVRLESLKRSRNWKTFGRGWTNRLNRIEDRIEYMA